MKRVQMATHGQRSSKKPHKVEQHALPAERSNLSNTAVSAIKTLQKKWRLAMYKQALQRNRMRKKTRQKLGEICIYLVFLTVFTLASVIVIQDQDLYWIVSMSRVPLQPLRQ